MNRWFSFSFIRATELTSPCRSKEVCLLPRCLVLLFFSTCGFCSIANLWLLYWAVDWSERDYMQLIEDILRFFATGKLLYKKRIVSRSPFGYDLVASSRRKSCNLRHSFHAAARRRKPLPQWSPSLTFWYFLGL